MKKTIAISTLSLLLLVRCTTAQQVGGSYSDGRNLEFRFGNGAKEFQYFLRSEAGVLQYSRGKAEASNNQLHLFGFNRDDIKKLDVESTITSSANPGRAKIEIHFNSDGASAYSKSIVLINDSRPYIIAKDTSLLLDYNIETIQIKSYPSYSGLSSSPPLIDTLYSSKINVGNGNSESKDVVLRFAVHPYDFNRVKFTDTITIKNGRTLYLNKAMLRKIAR